MAHPEKLQGKIMPLTEGRIKEWIEFYKKYPHTYCGEVAKGLIVTNEPNEVTCKVCEKALKHQRKEAKKFGLFFK